MNLNCKNKLFFWGLLLVNTPKKKRNVITRNKNTLFYIVDTSAVLHFWSEFWVWFWACCEHRECVWDHYTLIYPPVHFLFLRCSGNNKSGIFLSKHSSGHCPADGQFYFSKVIDTRFPTIPNIGMIQVLSQKTEGNTIRFLNEII